MALLAVAAVGAYLISVQTRLDAGKLMARAQEQFEAREFQTAAIDLKAVISEEPDNRQARLLLGRLYLESGNAKGALKELEKARELGLNEMQVGVGITRALLLTGKFDEAATEIAVSGDTSKPEWLVLRGMLDLAQQRLGARTMPARLSEASLNFIRKMRKRAGG